jgi:uncharacterized protein YdhG (YjbR/CyaY superfamily)
MQAAPIKFKTVEEYFSTLPQSTRAKLQALRDAIKKAAPNAQEVISYNMPAFKQKGILVYYAAYREHIGFYPTASGIANFKDEFSHYQWSKGAIQFPIDEPIPVRLVTKMVKFRAMEDEIKAKKK